LKINEEKDLLNYCSNSFLKWYNELIEKYKPYINK
jgi:hypothetical protein